MIENLRTVADNIVCYISINSLDIIIGGVSIMFIDDAKFGGVVDDEGDSLRLQQDMISW